MWDWKGHQDMAKQIARGPSAPGQPAVLECDFEAFHFTVSVFSKQTLKGLAQRQNFKSEHSGKLVFEIQSCHIVP